MARILYGPPGPQAPVLNFDTNRPVAEIQAIVHARFAEGNGIFLTLAGRMDSTGEESVTSYWFHPSIPLVFQYDALDVEGNYCLPVELDEEMIARCAGYGDEPLGVPMGFEPTGPYLPFAPPSGESDTPPADALGGVPS